MRGHPLEIVTPSKEGVNNGIRMKHRLLSSVRTELPTTYAVKRLPGRPVDFYEPNDCRVNGFPGGFGEYVASLSAECRRRGVRSVICNSRHAAAAFRAAGLSAEAVYHEYDSRYLRNRTDRVDRAVYLGSLCRTSLTPEDMRGLGVEPVDVQMSGDGMFGLPLRCVHVDVAPADMLCHHAHTSTKLATALALDAVFVCNRVPVYEEILGEGYPFFFDESDPGALPRAIASARAVSADPDALGEYLETVRPARELLSPGRVRREYERVFARGRSSAPGHDDGRARDEK